MPSQEQKRFLAPLLTSTLIGVLTIVGGAAPAGALAASPPPGDEPIVFVDANLKHCVERQLGVIADHPITPSDMATIRELSCFGGHSDIDISDLSDLRFATQLEDLALRGHNVSDFAPLTELDELTSLQMSHGKIVDITQLSGLTRLSNLDLSDNQITDVSPLEDLTGLTDLNLWGNRVNNVTPLSEARRLLYLDLAANHLSDVSPLAGLVQLVGLNLSANRITDITPLEGLSRLSFLGLGGNQISVVAPLSGLTALSWLDLSNNRISDLTPLSGLTNFFILRATGQSVSAAGALGAATPSPVVDLDGTRVPLSVADGDGTASGTDIAWHSGQQGTATWWTERFEGSGPETDFWFAFSGTVAYTVYDPSIATDAVAALFTDETRTTLAATAMASDIDAAEALVNLLPDSETRTELTAHVTTAFNLLNAALNAVDTLIDEHNNLRAHIEQHHIDSATLALHGLAPTHPIATQLSDAIKRAQDALDTSETPAKTGAAPHVDEATPPGGISRAVDDHLPRTGATREFPVAWLLVSGTLLVGATLMLLTSNRNKKMEKTI